MAAFRNVMLAVLVLGFAMHASAQQSIVSSSRSIDWQRSGVAWTLPSRETVCATLGPSATSQQINAAISSCPANQTVRLMAGTYNLARGITFDNSSNVTLRGAGADQTILRFTDGDPCHGTSANVCLDSGDTNYKGGPSNLANWTAGYTKGTTTITLSSTTRLSPGMIITLDQRDDTSDTGGIYVCSSSACATDGDGGAPRTGRAQQQIVTVTAINGTQVSITPGLYMPNWSSSKTPQAWWSSSPISNSGVEDVTLDHTNSGATAGVQFFNCVQCWVKGVKSVKANRSHVMIFQSARAIVRDSYFYENQNHASTSYGVETLPASDVLIENNIFQGVTAPRVINGCAGCVIAYNFSVNNRYTVSNAWMSHSDFLHAGGIDNLLFEGNVGQGIYSDTFHGTHHFVTAFRNRYEGFGYNGGAVTTGNTVPFPLFSFSRFYNVIGNVLGSVDRPHTNYQASPWGSGPRDQSIYALGYGNGRPDDARVEQTLMRWGNYDTVTGVRFESAEVPSGLASYGNPVPSSQALPPSMYLAGRPAWWPSNKPWPAIGPDVSGGNISGVAGHAYSIPAQDCYVMMGGPANGTGAALNFNAAACYASTPASAVPTAPGNLRIATS